MNQGLFEIQIYMMMPIATEHKIVKTFPADQEAHDDIRDAFSERLPSMSDGNIDVGVENLDLIFEETAVDNVPDNNDDDETKIPRGKSIVHHILFYKAVFLSFDNVFLSFDRS